MQCSATLDGTLGPRIVFGGGGGDDAGSQGCANADSYASGIAGRSGNFIDAIALSRCIPRRGLN